MIKRLFLIVILSIAGTSGYMALFEDRFIYFPELQIMQTPVAANLAFEEHRFKTSDGITLHGWYMPHPSARFTVLHFHGNAGNISHRISLYRRWHQLGLYVFAFDYRGYGSSDGEPGEEGLYEDGRAALRLLTGKLGVSPSSILISGRSLGAAVAVKLAAEVHPAGVALETPFTNIPDMAAYHYPWLPVRWLAKSRFDTLLMVGDISSPLLLISANDDSIAPSFMAERIFNAAREPKHYVSLSGGHNSFDSVSEQQYTESWRGWIDSLAEPETGVQFDAGDQPG